MQKSELIETIKSKDVKKIKDLKKYVEKHSKPRSKLWKEFYTTSMEESLKTENIDLKKALNANIIWPLASFFRNEVFSDFKNFYLKSITHKNGNIRQQLIKMSRYIFTPDMNLKKGKESKQEKQTFIQLLLTMINKYYEEEIDIIERQKPCIYKSLMLTLEEAGFYIESHNDKETNDKSFKLLTVFYSIYFPEDTKLPYGFKNDFFQENSESFNNKKEYIYYDAMEYLDFGEPLKAERILKEALHKYPDYIELYVGLAAVYKITGNKKSLNDIINKGYQKLIEKFPTWPKKMFWGVMSNRQYLRMIDLKAEKYQKEGKKDEAEELYRLLLKLNPNDNQGINYQLAGLYAGITPDKISEMFEEGNEKQDWSKLKNLVVTQHKKHDFIPAELIEEDEDWEEDENEDANTFTWNLN